MKQDQIEAIEEMRKKLKPGDTVYTILRHVSRSGMYRVIDAFVIRNNVPLRYSWTIARAIGARYDKRHEGIGISGCGMDMGFEIVYNLGRYLFPDGFGERCQSEGCSFRPGTEKEAKECNKGLEPGISPHEFYGRNGNKSGWDNDGGYALKQRWLA